VGEREISDAALWGAAASAVEEQFPGVKAWRGNFTGSWWALVPMRGTSRLVEAINPRELCEAISQAGAWPWPR
jgi:hypothetical protein